MIYLDNAATTKPSMSAFDRAREYAEEKFYNPSARSRIIKPFFLLRAAEMR